VSLSVNRGDVLVLGAGLVGPVTAMLLAQRGYLVTVVDRRPDPATSEPERGRSVHLVLSERGWRTLRLLGLESRVRAIGMPLQGRHIHLLQGDRLSQPYARDGSTIYCVDRTLLHETLVIAARERPGIHFEWGMRCRWMDLEGRRVGFVPEGAGTRTLANHEAQWRPFERLCAADGAFSAVRAALQEGRFDHQQFWLELGYKEIRLPSSADGGLPLSTAHFQVWPRNRLFLTAFPNPDGSFTGSLFMRWKGVPSFDGVRSEDDFRALLASFFPDLLPLHAHLWPQYRDHPASGLITVRCAPWTRDGRVVLLGDAAHAVVPFFGQGMNCGFEDARLLDEGLAAHGHDWSQALPAFEAERRPNVHALSEMSLRHYEHLNHVPDMLDPIRERIGDMLDRLAPYRYRPLYELVAFTSTPYATAMRLDELRRQAVDTVLRDQPIFARGDWPLDAESRLRSWLAQECGA
jgi:kynurenine 3-monooxygenase